MGGVQAVLSLALIAGPLMAGAAFDELGVPAPYFIGAILAALALALALPALALPAVALALPKGRAEPLGQGYGGHRNPRGLGRPGENLSEGGPP